MDLQMQYKITVRATVSVENYTVSLDFIPCMNHYRWEKKSSTARVIATSVNIDIISAWKTPANGVAQDINEVFN
jgi:hypothetical protein